MSRHKRINWTGLGAIPERLLRRWQRPSRGRTREETMELIFASFQMGRSPSHLRRPRAHPPHPVFCPRSRMPTTGLMNANDSFPDTNTGMWCDLDNHTKNSGDVCQVYRAAPNIMQSPRNRNIMFNINFTFI